MNVLSLFDGISCGQLALQRSNINYENYYASEIDPHAIKITQTNFPKTIQIGPVEKVCGKNYKNIDLLLAGSPCTSLSAANRSSESGLYSGQSVLFWEFLRVLKESEPKFFLLENVASMKKTDKDIISKELGVEPIFINSALVSAQSRRRYYWTNIPDVTQPTKKDIVLQDILESGIVDRDKSYCIDANYYKGTNLKHYINKHVRQIAVDSDKLNVLPDIFGRNNKAQGYRIYHTGGKAATLSAAGGGLGRGGTSIIIDDEDIRKLTPLECERLQTLPENYTKVEGVSKTQRYKSIGNGWTIDVISHILNHIK